MDWRNLTITFYHKNHKVVIRGDLSLTKTKVSLKSMIKSWIDSDKGFLMECREMEGEMTLAESFGVEEVPTIRESMPALLDKFEDVF